MNKIKKTIGIDARLYGPGAKGLGRYVKETVDRIIKNDLEHDFVVFLYHDNFSDFPADGIRVKKVLADIRWYTLKEQILFPWLIHKEKIDLMHFPHFNVPVFYFGKFVVTIHDLILTKFPSVRASTLSPFFYKFKNLLYRLVIRSALSRSERIISVSEFTKNDIVDNFKIDPAKIKTIYEGVVDLAKNSFDYDNDKKQILGYNKEDKFILYVGNFYPHKNLEGLVRIFSKIKDNIPGLRLYLVGKSDYFSKNLQNIAKELGLWHENDNDSSIKFLGYVSDQDLIGLFKNAFAYVFPSFYEGFGLPPLEAMQNGCPVLSSRESSLPEILGDAALYFNPYEMEEIIVHLKLLEDDGLREKFIKAGFEQVKKYSWEKSAEETAQIYKDILFIKR